MGGASEEVGKTVPNDLRMMAHVTPFAVFMVLLAVPDVLASLGLDGQTDDAPWYLSDPRQWLYPLQSVLCLSVLVSYRRQYQFWPVSNNANIELRSASGSNTHPQTVEHRFHGWPIAIIAGIAGIVVWITPGYLFRSQNMADGWWKYLGFAARTDGFDPTMFSANSSWLYWLVTTFRFLRLVVVVPLVEEIFWRGFLMRFLADIDGDYWKVPFGTHHVRSLIGVTACFVLAHSTVDYLAATVYGLLAYGIAVRTKSLSACVIMHATANLLLGLYIMATQQWGYW